MSLESSRAAARRSIGSWNKPDCFWPTDAKRLDTHDVCRRSRSANRKDGEDAQRDSVRGTGQKDLHDVGGSKWQWEVRQVDANHLPTSPVRKVTV